MTATPHVPAPRDADPAAAVGTPAVPADGLCVSAHALEQLRALAQLEAHGIVPESMAVGEWPTNIDRASPQGRAMIFAAGAPGDIEPGADGVIRMSATHFICYPDRAIDPDTGEETIVCRTVLYDRSGRTWRTTSAHMPQRVAQLCCLYSRAEWQRGIPLVITLRPSRRHKGGMWQDVRVDTAALGADS